MFAGLASEPEVRMIPLWTKVFSDQLTPVMAYRCLVPEKDLQVFSRLLESVQSGENVGRYSFIGARPIREVLAYAHDATITSHENGKTLETKQRTEDPWDLIRETNNELKPVCADSLPGGETLFCGGWVGYGGYDTMRYAELSSLPFTSAPFDDRKLPDLHFSLYRDVIIFGHVAKAVYIMHWVDLAENENSKSPDGLQTVHNRGMEHLEIPLRTLSRRDNY